MQTLNAFHTGSRHEYVLPYFNSVLLWQTVRYYKKAQNFFDTAKTAINGTKQNYKQTGLEDMFVGCPNKGKSN